MTKKYAIVEALKTSGLLTSDRIIIMMLVDLAELLADGDTWIVPEHRSPSLTELAEWTGLGRTTVAARLNALEGTGWVKRDRPATADALGRGERTGYRLAVGETVEKTKPSRPGRGRHAKDGTTAAPVQPLDQDTEAGSTAGLVQPLNDPSATAEPTLVQPLHQPSAAVAHKNPPPTGVGSTQSSQQDPTTPHAPPGEGASSDQLPIGDSAVPMPSKAPRKHRRPYGDADFDAFWEVYPRKDDPKKAWSTWQSAVKAAAKADRAALVTDIIAGAERYRDDPNRRAGFTKLATTWLNAGAWENGPLPPRGDDRASPGHQPYRNPESTAGYYEEL